MMATSEQTKTTIGEYIVESRLGEGGMGVVDLARHSGTGELVALKRLLKPSPALREALRREVRSLQTVSHPSVVKVVDSNLDAFDPWYAMEYINGTSLSKLLQSDNKTLIVPTTGATTRFWQTLRFDGSEGVEAAPAHVVSRTDDSWLGLVDVFLQVCSALSAIHEKGIIHRDLKPDNVLVRPNGQAVLVDFGISTGAAGSRGRERVSRNIGRAGTPAYMAPEQAIGESLDARADLYALGCMLFELFAGAPPFMADNPLEILHKQLVEDPPDIREINPTVPLELSTMLRQLLRKVPQRRPGYAFDVDRILRSALGYEPPPYEAPKYIPTPAFVGRVEELEAAKELFATPGGVLCVEGEPGIGKTRFLDEIARRFARDTFILTTRADSTKPLASMESVFELLTDHYRGVANIMDEVAGSVEVLAAFSPVLSKLPIEPLPNVGEFSPAVLNAMRISSIDALLTYHLRSAGPTTLFLDDYHAVDSATQAWCQDAALRHEQLTIVASYRPGTFPEPPFSHEQVVSLTLPPLSKEEHTEAIATMLSLDAVPGSHADVAYAHTNGNPFYLIDLAHSAVEHQFIRRDERGRWEVGRQGNFGNVLPMTELLAKELGTELSALHPKALEVAQSAAVLADQLTARALDEMVSAPYEALSELVKRQILVVHPQLKFRSQRVREAVVASLDEATCVELNTRALQALRVCHDRPDPLAMARMSEAAHLPSQAGEYYKGAAEDAARMGDIEKLTSTTIRYCELADSIDFEFVYGIVNSLSHLGMGRVHDASITNVVLARQDEIEDVSLWAYFRLRAISNRNWEDKDLEADFQETMNRVVEWTPMLKAEAHMARASIAVDRFDLEAEERNVRAAIECFIEAGDHFRASRTYMFLSSTLRGQRRFDEAIEAVNHGMAIAPARHPLDSCFQQLAVGMILVEVGKVADAEQHFLHAIDIAREYRIFGTVSLLAWGLSNCAFLLCNYDQAVRYLRESEALLQHQHVAHFKGAYHLLAADVAAADGRPEKAFKHYVLVNEIFHEAAIMWAFGRVYRARLKRRMGQYSSADEDLDSIIGWLENTPDEYLMALYCSERGHLQIARNEDATEAYETGKAGVDTVGFLEESEAAQAIEALRCAIEGETFRGEAIERWPPKLLQVARNAGAQ